MLGSACLSDTCRPLGAGAANNGEPSEAPETVFWTSIAKSAKAADFEAYLEQFPTGTFARLARLRIDEIEAAAKPAPVPPPAPQTPAAIGPADPAPVTASEMVKEAQKRLFALNFDPGPDDGRLGERTVDAIRAFQIESGLPNDGVLTEGVLEALRAKPDPKLWGAIVHSESEGNFGMTWGQESRTGALDEAQDSCGLKGQCTAELTFFTGRCGAFAHGDRGFALASGMSLETARGEALRTCRAKGKACEIVAEVCADGGGRFVAK